MGRTCHDQWNIITLYPVLLYWWCWGLYACGKYGKHYDNFFIRCCNCILLLLQTHTHIIANLQPYQEITVNISATTGGGESPSTLSMTVRTLAACELTSCTCHCVAATHNTGNTMDGMWQ